MQNPEVCLSDGSQLQEIQDAPNGVNQVVRFATRRQSTNQTAQPTIVTNVGNLRPCEDKSIFSFVTIFTNGLGFVTRSEVDLQQDHQGAGVRRNTIVPGSRRFDFKTSMHFSRFGFFISRMLCQGKIQRRLRRRFFIRLCGLRPVRCDHARRHNFKQRKKGQIFNRNQIDNEGVKDLLR